MLHTAILITHLVKDTTTILGKAPPESFVTLHNAILTIVEGLFEHVLSVDMVKNTTTILGTLIFIMIDFFFPLKKTRDSIPDLKCTGSSFVLSVSVKMHKYTFTQKKISIIMKMRVRALPD
jgi:hypothetical protein